MFLFDRGVKVQENCKRFPETTRLMETIPRRMGDVFFSFLNPKSLIKFHTGPLNVKVTAHLPLIVPKKSSPSDTRSCRMQVGSETKEFKEGKWLIFSDSFPHRVFNDLDTRRVVLIIDVWHKGITDVEVKCLEHIMQKIQGQQENKGFVNSVKNFLGIKKTWKFFCVLLYGFTQCYKLEISWVFSANIGEEVIDKGWSKKISVWWSCSKP